MSKHAGQLHAILLTLKACDLCHMCWLSGAAAAPPASLDTLVWSLTRSCAAALFFCVCGAWCLPGAGHVGRGFASMPVKHMAEAGLAAGLSTLAETAVVVSGAPGRFARPASSAPALAGAVSAAAWSGSSSQECCPCPVASELRQRFAQL